MKYIDEFRNLQIAQSISRKIRENTPEFEINLMEVCGGHTITILKYRINDLLPENFKLISGPGCPVCVTNNDFIDKAIEISHINNIIVATFGDLMRVPGSRSKLLEEKASGSDIRICYSPMEAIQIAEQNPENEIIFLGIGFETTAPLVAAAIVQSQLKGLKNFSVLSSHKTMPMAMKTLLDSGDVALNGFVCPGHVSTIAGTKMYEFIAKDYKIPCVVSGFEPNDILESILMLAKQILERRAEVENQYKRSVRPEGNLKAIKLMEEVFEPVDMPWRGLGVIPQSGLKIRKKYKQFDADEKFQVKVPPPKECPGCICGDIMRGVKIPTQCKLFKRVCTPEDPKGACMVSEEGTCATYFKYVS